MIHLSLVKLFINIESHYVYLYIFDIINNDKEVVIMKKVINEVEITLSIIGGKWKSLILYYIGIEGVKRYSEIFTFLGNISQKTLTTQLRQLEKDGVLKREIFPSVPPTVEYSLTEKGETLKPILELLCEWGEQNNNGEYELQNPYCTPDHDKKDFSQ